MITSEDGRSAISRPIQDLFSSQEGADTRIILHYSYISNQKEIKRVILKSPDTDVFFFLLSFADKINKILLFDTGTRNKRRQIDMSSLASSMSSSLREAILSLNAFTGLDTTSYFAGKGKERPLKTLKKDQSVIDVFARLGTTEEVSTADRLKLEAFVCALYGKETYSSVDKLRYNKVRQSSKGIKSTLSCSDGVDLSQMPPCDQVLQLHYIKSKLSNPCVEEVTCLTFFYLPDPTENGWVDSPSEELAIQRFSDNLLSRVVRS